MVGGKLANFAAVACRANSARKFSNFSIMPPKKVLPAPPNAELITLDVPAVQAMSAMHQNSLAFGVAIVPAPAPVHPVLLNLNSPPPILVQISSGADHLPDTVARPKARGQQVNAAIMADENAQQVQQVPKGKEYLFDTKLHGLQPCLSVRTRIMLSTWAQNQMSPSDIGKSFEVAGYVPRQRPAKLRAALNYLATKNGQLLPGEARESRRSSINEVRGFVAI